MRTPRKLPPPSATAFSRSDAGDLSYSKSTLTARGYADKISAVQSSTGLSLHPTSAGSTEDGRTLVKAQIHEAAGKKVGTMKIYSAAGTDNAVTTESTTLKSADHLRHRLAAGAADAVGGKLKPNYIGSY